MGYIAKGTITLSNVNDAYTVSLSKQSCVIHADFDGTNPQLDDANTTIKVYRGEKEVAFDCSFGGSITNAYMSAYDERKRYILTISSVSESTLEGAVPIIIKTDDGFETTAEFSYSIARESTMLDWIKDWEGGKTKVGGTYIMTPKIFIGKKSKYESYAEGGDNEVSSITVVPGLTGVYIGPDSDSTGIYGYKNGVEIFHLNNDGGMIGGWIINEQSICSTDGLLNIQSNGSIITKDSNGDRIWEINSNGSAAFAKGNVQFFADGSAEFAGKITSTEGSIAGWTMLANQIFKDNLYLDASDKAIGIARDFYLTNVATNEKQFLNGVMTCGGVAMYYTSDTNWGLVGYGAGEYGGNKAQKTFQLGSTNKIAEWQFDNEALWSGVKNDTSEAYTTTGITMGATGLRSTQWRFEADGSGALAGGNIAWNTDGSGTLAGDNISWDSNGNLNVSGKITSTSGSIGGIAINSNSIGTNTYSLNSDGSTSFANGKVSFSSDGSGMLAGGNITWDSSGNLSVLGKVTSTSGCIGGWNIAEGSLYVGTETTDSNSFTSNDSCITLGSTGIRGNKWRLEADGSGALAGGNFIWDTDGNITALAGMFKGELHAKDLFLQAHSVPADTADTDYITLNGSFIPAINHMKNVTLPKLNSGECKTVWFVAQLLTKSGSGSIYFSCENGVSIFLQSGEGEMPSIYSEFTVTDCSGVLFGYGMEDGTYWILCKLPYISVSS